jgi:TatD DNase family protein
LPPPDFPDFSAELDAIVARARGAGVGRIVTISTRVKRHAQIFAIAEKFPGSFLLGRHSSALLGSGAGN